MQNLKYFVPFSMLAMGAIIALSNILVQYPLGQWLTYGALTYPLAFLVTDLVTRTRGASIAKRVIIVGFMVGIVSSLIASTLELTTLRIAIASGVGFLAAHFLDVFVFQRLRHLSWWQTPALSSTLASVVDTFLFFSIAFSATTFALFIDGNTWAQELVPLLGFGPTFPLWVSLAVADLAVKLLLVIPLLLPYRALTKGN